MARRVAWFASLALVSALAAGATIGLADAGRGSAAATAAVPAPPDPSGDPVAFVKRVVDAVVADDYRRAWRTLHRRTSASLRSRTT